MTIHFMHRLFALTAVSLLAGCSALQIDVDVYKGGLTNSPEVQQRQVCAHGHGGQAVDRADEGRR